ncbi:MAG: prolipoprotein diacylglyceryl transferase family protein [Phycisphaerae bacterium]
MRPELWKIPWVGISLKSYGVMLMLGFLFCIWLAMRRAMRVKADPDIILNIGFVSLFCGVGGARIFFVAHYWKTDFAWQENPIWSAINISAGGLEYYGGLVTAILGGIIYLRYFGRYYAVGDDLHAKPKRRTSVRLYLDILAPSVMLGLAFGRAGCFLNGCCWGGVCAEHQQGRYVASLPWALTFPFASGAHHRQWENRVVTVPAELIYHNPRHVNAPYLLWWDSLDEPAESIDGPVRRLRELTQQYSQAKADAPDSQQTAALKQQLDQAREEVQALAIKHHTIFAAMQFDSRKDPSRKMTFKEIKELAAGFRSAPVHPAQLYGLINAVLISMMLATLFHRRKRHGMVFGTMLLVYPITRTVLELIRVDNPHDMGGLTISQAVSVGMFAVGLVYMILLYTRMDLRSKRTLPCAPLGARPKASSNSAYMRIHYPKCRSRPLRSAAGTLARNSAPQNFAFWIMSALTSAVLLVAARFARATSDNSCLCEIPIGKLRFPLGTSHQARTLSEITKNLSIDFLLNFWQFYIKVAINLN